MSEAVAEQPPWSPWAREYARTPDVIGLELSLDGLRKAARLAADRAVRVGWVYATMPNLPRRAQDGTPHVHSVETVLARRG